MHNDDYFDHAILSDEEIESLRKRLLAGEYPFEVIKAEKKLSKSSGNPMIELTLKIWDQEGNEFKQFDWITNSPKMAWKTKHFWESVGLPEKYNTKNLVSDYENKCG